MSASSPTTRTVPAAIARGERRELRREEPDVRIERGVLEAQRQLRVHLVASSRCGRSRRRRGGSTRRRRPSCSSSPRSPSRPVSWPISSSPANRSSTRTFTSYRGASKVPCPTALNCMTPDSGAVGNGSGLQRLDRDLRAVGVERVVAVPADPRGAGDRSRALLDRRGRRDGRPSPRSAARPTPSRTSRRTRRRPSIVRSPESVRAFRSCRTGGTRRTPAPRPASRRARTRGAGPRAAGGRS